MIQEYYNPFIPDSQFPGKTPMPFRNLRIGAAGSDTDHLAGFYVGIRHRQGFRQLAFVTQGYGAQLQSGFVCQISVIKAFPISKPVPVLVKSRSRHQHQGMFRGRLPVGIYFRIPGGFRYPPVSRFQFFQTGNSVKNHFSPPAPSVHIPFSLPPKPPAKFPGY